MAEFRWRLGVHWYVKVPVLAIGLSGFFIAYFWILRHPQYPIFTMPLTPIDAWVGFWPPAFYLYISIWPYVSLAPATTATLRDLWTFGQSAIVLSVVGLLTFYYWPTAVPPPDVDWSQHTSVAFLKAVDMSGNACPSMHVAFAVFTAIWFTRTLRATRARWWLQMLNWLWCLGILYSTLAIRQHVFLDVVAGAALAVVVALLSRGPITGSVTPLGAVPAARTSPVRH